MFWFQVNIEKILDGQTSATMYQASEYHLNLGPRDNLEFAVNRLVEISGFKGIGGMILHEGVRVVTEQFKAKKIYLEAQEYAIGYYAKEGFKAYQSHLWRMGFFM